MAEIRGKLRVVLFHRDDSIASLDAFCPACDRVHSFNVDLEGHGHWDNPERPKWSFDGNWESPTFSPSMLANKDSFEVEFPICHSFLENGVWRYLNDSTHRFAGQQVPLPSPDPTMRWERLHGWHIINPSMYGDKEKQTMSMKDQVKEAYGRYEGAKAVAEQEYNARMRDAETTLDADLDNAMNTNAQADKQRVHDIAERLANMEGMSPNAMEEIQRLREV